MIMNSLTYLLIGYAAGCLAGGFATWLCVSNHYKQKEAWRSHCAKFGYTP